VGGVAQLDPTTRARLASLRRWLVAVAAVALVWAVYLLDTGGFAVRLGSLQFSSHHPGAALLIAIATGAGAIAVSRRLGDAALSWSGAWSQARATVPEAILIAIVIAAAVLDLHQLFGAAPLWLDEEMIALNLRDRSFAELGGRLWLEQSAPYGWLILQRAIMLTLGTSEIALRLVPTLFGIGTYLTALWIGRRWLTWAASLALVLLCVFGHAFSHFRVEVKHYSGDAFWALLLPALAVWASEAATPASRVRRSIVWWAIAATGLWLANGAILVAPASALFILGTTYVHGGARAALKQAAWGCVWFASFALHYVISLRYTAYLRDYWAAWFHPTGVGVPQTISWLLARLDRIATTAAGSEAGGVFWILAILGFAWSARRGLAIVYGGVTLSGFLFAALRVVPMFDRFSLWMVPALYIGIALLIDRADRSAHQGFRQRNWPLAAASAAVGCVAVLVGAGILVRGAGRFHMERPTMKQGVDDRTAVTWLMSHRQPGDALISTPLGLPAIWWYGGISIAKTFAAGQHTGGTFEVVHRPRGNGCALPALLKGHDRALVYIGFPDMMQGFDELLFTELDRIGTITAYREVTPLSRAAVVDLTFSAPNDQAYSRREARPPLNGCVGGRPAVRR
jgi:hypothetical protein